VGFGQVLRKTLLNLSLIEGIVKDKYCRLMLRSKADITPLLDFANSALSYKGTFSILLIKGKVKK